MSHLTNPFQNIIQQAAATLAADTGATETAAAELKRRAARTEHATGGVYILADVSSSMSDYAGGRRKIELLRQALAMSLHDTPAAQIVAFSSVASPSGPDLPEPSGSTALHLAFAHIEFERPRATLIISDGKPNDEAAALSAAERITGIIDVIYVGPDDDRAALAFMNRLARLGAGRVHVYDMRRDPVHVPRAITSIIRAIASKAE